MNSTRPCGTRMYERTKNIRRLHQNAEASLILSAVSLILRMVGSSGGAALSPFKQRTGSLNAPASRPTKIDGSGVCQHPEPFLDSDQRSCLHDTVAHRRPQQ
jgi:hypothetical protein